MSVWDGLMGMIFFCQETKGEVLRLGLRDWCSFALFFFFLSFFFFFFPLDVALGDTILYRVTSYLSISHRDVQQQFQTRYLIASNLPRQQAVRSHRAVLSKSTLYTLVRTTPQLAISSNRRFFPHMEVGCHI